MRKILIVAALVCVAAALGLGGAAYAGWRFLNDPMTLPASGQIIDVAPGTPLSSLARQLNQNGILERPRVFSLYARVKGDATRIKAGEYQLEAGLTPLDLMEKLIAGDVVLHAFTIVEGVRFSQMLAELQAHEAVVTDAETTEDVMAALGLPETHPEGQFLPDTYLFPQGTSDLDVLQQAHDALQTVLANLWAEKSDESVLQSSYEALILASIIEKETALGSERPLIAGVFNERLRVGMRLQTDPTVIYGMGEMFDGNLRRRDLETDTPYNTYTRNGLPPTPIALPGEDAIRAAVGPVSDGSLYFVATGLPDGSHKFSKTIEEHNAAVRAYLRQQRSQQ